MHAAMRAAGQLPDEKRVDIPEENFARLSLLPQAGYIFEKQANLQAAEVCCEWKAGFRAETILAALERKFLDEIRSAGVLPHERIGDGRSGSAIPEEGGFALVRDAHSGNIAGL